MSGNDTFKEELAKVDTRIAELQGHVAMGKALEALHKKDEFKLVFGDGYFDREEKRIAGLLFTPSGLKRDQLQNIMDKASAIRGLKQYFATILIDANMAPEQIEEEELYRKSVTAEASDVLGD